MLGFSRFFKQNPATTPARGFASGAFIESLEDRRLLSASLLHHSTAHTASTTKLTAAAKHAAAVKAARAARLAARAAARAVKAAAKSAAVTTTSTSSSSSPTSSSGTTTTDDNGFDPRAVANTVTFAQVPTAVQNGLKTLATTDGVTAPTSTTTVYLANRGGIESYSIVLTSSGTTTRLTVDQTGAAVTAPTQSTTTWAILSGTGTGSAAAAAAEISAIASALGLTAPTATTVVNVSTPTSGPAVYSVQLSSSTTSTTTSTTADDDWHGDNGNIISVDAAGNPVGRQDLPFSVLPTAIQTGINAHRPTGATALPTDSTQIVHVLTANGITFYTTTFSTTGTTTDVTVNSLGTTATLPNVTTVEFQTLPTAAQSELQTLATANGVSATISTTQSVSVYDEGNGTKVYSVSLTATSSTSSQTFTVTVAVDQAGNPTVPPGDGGAGGCGGGGGGGEGRRGRDRFGGGTSSDSIA